MYNNIMQYHNIILVYYLYKKNYYIFRFHKRSSKLKINFHNITLYESFEKTHRHHFYTYLYEC